MTDSEKKDTIPHQAEVVSWVDFLQEQAPGRMLTVKGAWKLGGYDGKTIYASTPELQLYCPNDTCKGYMFFSTKDSIRLPEEVWGYDYLTYHCRNCQTYSKTFALAMLKGKLVDAQAYKFGELPHFGPPTPPRVIRLIQPDRELFLSGRRCEDQGLGIGAVSYYRRVVENQWSRLVDEIIKVARGIGAGKDTLEALSASRDEQQFSKAVKNVKDAIPPSLLINGQNPLTLLHGTLSLGVHDLSDDECLSIATSIRVILFELADKLGQALKDEKEITTAVGRLLQVQEERRIKKADIQVVGDAGQELPGG